MGTLYVHYKLITLFVETNIIQQFIENKSYQIDNVKFTQILLFEYTGNTGK